MNRTLRYLRRYALGLLLALGAVAPSLAQSLDPTFAPTTLKATPTGRYTTRVMLRQPDGKILVGGDYDFVDGALASRLRRLNADGSPDNTFNAGQLGLLGTGLVQALALQPDGKLLVGASDVDAYNRTVAIELLRLNPDGTLDTSFNAGNLGFGSGYRDWIANNQGVRSLAVQPDGKILVGGTFEIYNGFNGPRFGGLLRLLPDGTVDASFNAGTGVLAGTGQGRVDALLVQADGKLLVGGSFDSYNGQPALNLVRLNADGSRDVSFGTSAFGSSATDQVRALLQQPDGKLLVGGLFAQFNGQPSPNLLRLNLDGSRDASFNPGTGAQGVGIYQVRRQADGSLLVMGNFTAFNGTTRGGAARLSANGALDASFNAAGTGANNLVYDVLPLASGQWLIGGIFTAFNGVPRTGLARLSTAAGTLDATYNPVIEFRGDIYGAFPLSSGQLVVVGDFTTFNGRPATPGELYLLNADGTYNSAYAPGLSAWNAEVLPDGRFYQFTSNTANTSATFARWLPGGAPDPSFAPVTLALDPQPSFKQLIMRSNPAGGLLLTGYFNTVNGVPRDGVAKISDAGVLAPGFAPTGNWRRTPNSGTGITNSFRGYPLATGQVLMLWADGQRSNLVRLNANGSVDNTFALGSGPYNGPTSFAPYFEIAAVQADGKPLISGYFISFSGQPALNLVRLDLSGAPDPSFTAAAYDAYSSLKLQPDGRLLLMREATNADAELVRLNADGTLDASFTPVAVPYSRFGGMFATIKLQPQDGKILLNGTFPLVAGQPRIGLARLTNTLLATRPAFAAAVQLDVFPNPTSGSLTLRLPPAATPQPLRVYDLNGRLVRELTWPARQAEHRLELADVALGIYVLEAVTAQGPARQRLVLTR